MTFHVATPLSGPGFAVYCRDLEYAICHVQMHAKHLCDLLNAEEQQRERWHPIDAQPSPSLLQGPAGSEGPQGGLADPAAHVGPLNVPPAGVGEDPTGGTA